jgi:tetratricopeptide (TPR) repeat protein
MTAKMALRAACALLACGSVAASWAGSTNDRKAEGLALYQAGRYAEAVDRLDAVIGRHPNDSEALAKRGGAYLRLNRPSKALADFDRIVDRDPTSTTGWTDRGIALMMLGRLDEAEAAFVRSVRLWDDPLIAAHGLGAGGRDAVQEARATSYAGLAQVHHRLKRHDEALAEYDQAIRIYPSDPNSRIGRGDVHRALGDLPRALADLDEAVRLGPNLPRAFASRGRILEEMKQDDRAEQDYSQAIAMDPNYAFAYRLRGAIRSRTGRNQEALRDFEVVGRLRPNDAENHKDRGGVLVRASRNEEALAELDRALAIDPKNAKAYQNRGAAYNNLRRYEDAVADLDRAIDLEPENAGARTNCGLALFMLGEYERSLEDLGVAVKLAPGNAIVHLNRGNVYAKLGLREQALADYRAVEEADPRLLASLGGVSGLLAEMTRDRMALRSPSPRPDAGSEADDRMREGRSCQASGDWPRAVEAFDRAAAADPRRADVNVPRGRSRLCADVDGAETDARAFINLAGWGDPAAPYMAILGVLAERRAGRDTAAYAFLEEALAKLPRSDAWPRPALLHLNGDLPEAALITAAGNDVQRGEAHAIAALTCLRNRKRAEAREHLAWVHDHVVDRSVAADLARATLARLDQADQIAREP